MHLYRGRQPPSRNVKRNSTNNETFPSSAFFKKNAKITKHFTSLVQNGICRYEDHAASPSRPCLNHLRLARSLCAVIWTVGVKATIVTCYIVLRFPCYLPRRSDKTNKVDLVPIHYIYQPPVHVSLMFRLKNRFIFTLYSSKIVFPQLGKPNVSPGRFVAGTRGLLRQPRPPASHRAAEGMADNAAVTPGNEGLPQRRSRLRGRLGTEGLAGSADFRFSLNHWLSRVYRRDGPLVIPYSFLFRVSAPRRKLRYILVYGLHVACDCEEPRYVCTQLSWVPDPVRRSANACLVRMVSISLIIGCFKQFFA